jgi:hypothetical protein
MGTIEVKEYNTQTKKIEFFPCVKCGSENIDFGDYGYSSFNVSWGKCLDCKSEVEISPCSWRPPKEEIIEKWNKENNPKLLREKYKKQIEGLQKLIDSLPKEK